MIELRTGVLVRDSKAHDTHGTGMGTRGSGDRRYNRIHRLPDRADSNPRPRNMICTISQYETGDRPTSMEYVICKAKCAREGRMLVVSVPLMKIATKIVKYLGPLRL